MNAKKKTRFEFQKTRISYKTCKTIAFASNDSPRGKAESMDSGRLVTVDITLILGAQLLAVESANVPAWN